MDFGNTPATLLTERIMADIREHLKDDAPGYPTHYNRVYESVHRLVSVADVPPALAGLRDALARKEQGNPRGEARISNG